MLHVICSPFFFLKLTKLNTNNPIISYLNVNIDICASLHILLNSFDLYLQILCR